MSASTPQGCVWNTFRSASDIARPSASTPQGCVWNRGTTASTPACVRASTPQGCVWNTGDGVTCSMTAVLQPHKGASGTAAEETPTNAVWASTPQGCVWNHAGITGYTCCRGRTHTSVSVDPQFTPNPWGVDGESRPVEYDFVEQFPSLGVYYYPGDLFLEHNIHLVSLQRGGRMQWLG